MNQSNCPKTKKRTLSLVISIIIVFTLTAGCGNNDNNNKPSNSVNSKVYNEGAANKETDGSSNSGIKEPDVPAQIPAEPSPAEPDDKTNAGSDVTNIEEQGKGTYIGQADTNSIEIKTSDGTSTVYQVDDTMFEKVSLLKENTAVTYTFIEKVISDSEGGEKIKQLWLTSIKAE